MNILVVTKRFTSAKDISRESVGRPFCLFAALAGIGHRVIFLLADYREKQSFESKREGVDIHVRPFGVFGLGPFRKRLRSILCHESIDMVVAEGDPLFALVSTGVCGRLGIPLIYDLMDNYETYDIYRIPFFGFLDRRLIRKAGGVVCATRSLKDKISGAREDGVYVVGNGVDTGLFRPMGREECRGKLSLPVDRKIIGYFGHIVDYKGALLLLEAHRMLLKKGRDVLLLLAGNRDRGVKLPADSCLYRGIVPQQDIPIYINACDCVALPSPENPFTRYSFPLKILEGLSCGVPVVATDVGPVRTLLGCDYRWLARAGDIADMAGKIEDAINSDRRGIDRLARGHGWADRARELERVMEEVKQCAC